MRDNGPALTRVGGIAVASVLGLLALAGPASALGAQRYASPSGAGSTCSQQAPCSLLTAVNGASGGDEVIVPGDQGTYGSPTSPITTQLHDAPGGLNLHGVAGQPMPVIYLNVAGNAIQLNSGGTATYLHIENLSSSGTALFVGHSASQVYAGGGLTGCTTPPFITLVDSVCRGGTNGIDGFSSASGTQNLTFRNVTAIGLTGTGISLGATGFTQDVLGTNLIARGGTNAISTSESGGSVTFTLDHSNYASTNPGVGTSITPAGTGTNQTTPPIFANAPLGDFQQAAGSPTIDKGSDSALNGLFDFEGKPRTFGPHTDIGADEYAPPAVLAESVSAITATSATFGGMINVWGGVGSAWVDYGPTTAYGSSAPAGALAVSASPQSTSAGVGGLQPGTTYHYRLAATNGSGTVFGPDQTFATPATPPPPKRKCKKKGRHRSAATARKHGCRKHKRKH
jgi:hypothetical protein